MTTTSTPDRAHRAGRRAGAHRAKARRHGRRAADTAWRSARIARRGAVGWRGRHADDVRVHRRFRRRDAIRRLPGPSLGEQAAAPSGAETAPADGVMSVTPAGSTPSPPGGLAATRSAGPGDSASPAAGPRTPILTPPGALRTLRAGRPRERRPDRARAISRQRPVAAHGGQPAARGPMEHAPPVGPGAPRLGWGVPAGWAPLSYPAPGSPPAYPAPGSPPAYPAPGPPPAYPAGPAYPPPAGWGPRPTAAPAPKGSPLTGARLLAWTGGAVTLLGVVLLLALAASRGWFTPPARIAFGARARRGAGRTRRCGCTVARPLVRAPSPSPPPASPPSISSTPPPPRSTTTFRLSPPCCSRSSSRAPGSASPTAGARSCSRAGSSSAPPCSPPRSPTAGCSPRWSSRSSSPRCSSCCAAVGGAHAAGRGRARAVRRVRRAQRGRRGTGCARRRGCCRCGARGRPRDGRARTPPHPDELRRPERHTVGRDDCHRRGGQGRGHVGRVGCGRRVRVRGVACDGDGPGGRFAGCRARPRAGPGDGGRVGRRHPEQANGRGTGLGRVGRGRRRGLGVARARRSRGTRRLARRAPRLRRGGAPRDPRPAAPDPARRHGRRGHGGRPPQLLTATVVGLDGIRGRDRRPRRGPGRRTARGRPAQPVRDDHGPGARRVGLACRGRSATHRSRRCCGSRSRPRSATSSPPSRSRRCCSRSPPPSSWRADGWAGSVRTPRAPPSGCRSGSSGCTGRRAWSSTRRS